VLQKQNTKYVLWIKRHKVFTNGTATSYNMNAFFSFDHFMVYQNVSNR